MHITDAGFPEELSSVATGPPEIPSGTGPYAKHLAVQTANNTRSATSERKASTVYASLSTLSPLAKYGIAAVFLCLLYAIVDAAHLAQLANRNGKCTFEAIDRLSSASICKLLDNFDVIFAPSLLAMDSALTEIIAPLLPQFSYEHGDNALLLFFMRPIVSIAILFILPFLLQSGVHGGRIFITVGLLGASLSCLTFAVAASFSLAILAQAVRSIGSALIMATTIYNVILQAPVEQAGWRINSAVFGIAMGSTFGPCIGSELQHLCGLRTMMVIMSVIFAGAAHVELALLKGMSRYQMLSNEANHLTAMFHQRSVFQEVFCLLKDKKRGVVLLGLGIVSAVLALHSTLLPFALGRDKPFAGPSDFVVIEEIATLIFGLAIISCGFVADSVDEMWAARGMIVATVMSVLGMRCMAENSTDKWFVSCCIIQTHAGLGLYAGLALPVLSRLTRGDGVCPHVCASAIFSSALGILILLGDALGVGLQLVLYPIAGFKATVLAFAVAAAGQAIAVLFCPGWTQRGSQTRFSLDSWQGHMSSIKAP